MRAQSDPALGPRLSSIRVDQQFPAAWVNSASAPKVIVKSDGKVHFFRDIYGHDKLLDTALKRKTIS